MMKMMGFSNFDSTKVIIVINTPLCQDLFNCVFTNRRNRRPY